jgi:hypothetical protein
MIAYLEICVHDTLIGTLNARSSQEMLNVFELKTLKGFLRDARDLISDALHLTKDDDNQRAARLKRIAQLLAEEISITDRKLADAERFEEGGTGK